MGPTTWLISVRPSTLFPFQSQEGLGLFLAQVSPARQSGGQQILQFQLLSGHYLGSLIHRIIVLVIAGYRIRDLVHQDLGACWLNYRRPDERRSGPSPTRLCVIRSLNQFNASGCVNKDEPS